MQVTGSIYVPVYICRPSRRVLSGTESEKSKAGLRTWQINNPGALEAASTRGSAIHLACENYLRGLDPGVPEEYQDFWNGMSQYLDWFDVLHWSESDLCVLTGITSGLMTKKLLTSGVLNICTLDVLT